MRAKTFLLFGLLACFLMLISAFAQEGHPLKGTWLGDWGPNRTDRTQVTILLEWDGKQITGVVNPGPGSIPIQKASLEPKGWLVHFEVDAKNNAGQPVHYVVDGKIENLGSVRRSIVGSWIQGNQKGDFKITRH